MSENLDNKEVKLDATIENEPILFFEPLEISTENLAEDINVQYDKNEFIKGLKDASYFAGLYTGLINAAFTQEDAITLIFNRMNIENNIEISKINANSNIECSKNTLTLKEKEIL